MTKSITVVTYLRQAPKQGYFFQSDSTSLEEPKWIQFYLKLTRRMSKHNILLEKNDLL